MPSTVEEKAKMKSLPLVSVCIASYNHEQYIKETVQSVIRQVYDNWELIIVDDASTDSSPELLKKLADEYPGRIKVILLKENVGVSRAANRVVSEAQGKYLAWMGSDDRMHPDRLTKQVRFLQKNRNVAAVFSCVNIINDEGRVVPEHNNIFDREIGKLRLQLLEGNFLNAPSVMARASVWREVGEFNPELLYVQDYDFWLRLLDRYEIVRLDERLTDYRVHGKNLSISSSEDVTFATYYETAICMLNAIQRWSVEDLFPVPHDTDAETRRAGQVRGVVNMGRLCMGIDRSLFQRPFLGTAQAYRFALNAIQIDPENELARDLMHEVYRVLGDLPRANGEGKLKLMDWHRQVCTTGIVEPVADSSTGFVSDEQRLQYLREKFLHRAEESGYVLPSIHLIMVADESNVVKIADTIDSLGQQVYAGWGLSVISAMPPPHQDFDALPMLEWIQSEDVGQSFVDTVLKSACDWVAPVMPGDKLEPEALSVFVDYINQNSGWKFVYSDEDCVDASGKQVNHKFKPDINPDYLCSCPYIGNLSLVHRDMLEQLSSDINIPAASFYDLALKVLRNHGASAIGHIPTLLYHQLQDNERQEARDMWVKPVLEAYVRRNEIDARVLPGTVSGTCMIDYRCSDAPEVCIAIYVGSDFARVERTVASLLNKTAYSNWTIRLGVDMAIAPLFDKYQSEQLSVDPLDKKASRCSYFDSLAQTANADYMVFMDSGVIVLQDNWLERLLAQGQRPDVGVVGIRLLSPKNKVAHAGIVTGIGSFGIGDCIGEGDTLEQEGYMQRSQVVQNLSAVSSACMLVNRSLFQLLQGFDAGIAVQLYSDVDFCLRVRETGKRIVWTPFVTMLISDDRLDTYAGDGGKSRVEQDARQVTSKWLARLASDPAYNRNLTLKQADFSREAGFKPVWDPNIRDFPRITGCGVGSYVPWAYRVAQPLAALSAAGRASHSNIPFTGKDLVYMPSVVEMERIQPDVLLLHNTLHDHCLDALRQYRKMNNIFMVFSQDDLMFAVPPKSSCFKTGYKDIKKRLRTCLSMVDRLVVTSEPLADELSGFISDIRVVPNRLDAGVWGTLESRRGCAVKPRVGWAGAMQHHGDLEMMANAVRETADEVDWIFMGMCPEFLRPYVKEVHEYVAFSAYPETLAKLNLDLAVAPLERNRFNRSKSNLRILEYGAMGWPVIATDIEPYQEAPVHLVSNQTRAWVNAIREHIHDLDTTWKAGDTLREWVRKNYLLQQHLDDWLDALDPSDGSHCQSLAPGKASGL